MKKTTHSTGHRWTTTDLKQLMQLWADDVPMPVISQELNATQHAILKQVQRMSAQGIPLKRRTVGHQLGTVSRLWTKGEVEYLIRRRNEKATMEDIAKEVRRSPNAVSNMIGRLRGEGVEVPMLGNGVRRLWDPSEL